MFATPASLQVCAGISGNPFVKVYARTRPLLPQECDLGAKNILEVSSADKQVVVLEDGGDKIFKYDDVFEEYCSQEKVYMKAVEPLVTKVEKGYNATVFAYGQTGSGKTFTMGTNPCIAKEDEGILQRALHGLLGNDENKLPVDDLEGISSPASRSLTMSIIEVYNEMIFDLLASSRIPLKTKAGPRGAVSVVGMVQKKVESIEEGLALLKKGNHLRSVGATAMNQHSSRSHALIYLNLRHGKHHGCLRLVDLAGAEGVGRAQSSRQQFTEGVNINKGLLTLGKVLAALSNPTSSYIPFRDSLLTRLLKDSLGGTSYTVMIACVNPANFNVYETINTLRYAEQTRNIKTKPQAFSTVKKSGAKRRFEDVSATPGLWKKRVMDSGKKQEHNSTISTPGHKPPAKLLVSKLNDTFATPSNRMSEVLSNSELKTGCSIPLAVPMFPTLCQPIFEDDSPSRFSTVSAIEDTETHHSTFSPYIDRVTSRLEQSMMAQLESIEDRLANNIISKITHMKLGKHSSLYRKLKRQSRSKRSTPTTNKDHPSSGVNDSLDDDTLGTSIVNALFRKLDMKSMLQDVVSNALENISNDDAHSRSTQQIIIPSNLTSKTLSYNPVGKPLGDLTNTQKRSENSCLKMSDKKMLYNLPLTSTAKVDKRQSTRLSTRSSTQSLLFDELSPQIYSGMCSDSYFTHDDTAVLRNEGSSVLRSPNFETQLQSKEDTVELSWTSKSTVLSRRISLKNKHLKSLENTNSQTCGSSVNVNCSSPHASRVLESDQGKRRRSSRLSAMRATQCNYEIFQGKCPFTSLCKKKRSPIPSQKRAQVPLVNTSLCVVPSSITALENNKRKPIVSPCTQKQHYHNILKILNTGDLKKLQQLPTVGPKTALVIFNYRKLYGTFSSVEELKIIPALSKTHCARFMNANLLNELNF